ncbi:A-kinase anchor protein 7 isoform gamma [Plakobranchus ocellatus]|uniref:A-kinase anchor protein 7 isoform gamma n=1 Tax=Plakobranchus ocellatus TaxID=259542 RepID=A0AAV4CR69_9GAST|nr:A-kinase anchor protein 7 isoform gamma [Plakobranchus ocellatus]
MKIYTASNSNDIIGSFLLSPLYVLKDELRNSGVNVVERHDFLPHVTILKINTMRARKAKVEKINPWLYVNLKDKMFGQQTVDSVHLCKMGYERRWDGFYNTPAEIIFRT